VTSIVALVSPAHVGQPFKLKNKIAKNIAADATKHLPFPFMQQFPLCDDFQVIRNADQLAQKASSFLGKGRRKGLNLATSGAHL
jgi:hypothetical protein